MMLSGVLLSAEALCRKGLSTNDVLGTIRTATGTEEIIVLIDTALDLDISRRAIEGGISGFVNVGGGRVDKQALRRHVMAAVRRTGERRGQHGAFQEFKAFDDGGFIARSPLMAEVLSKTIKAAKISDVPVIIYGESGTGKQLLAEMIQRLDPKRCRRRFLAVNCASISGTLADSELFGHVKGAFTGATENRLGHFRAADGGTMLLDEIGELDPALQPKLLRVLQEGVGCPVGSDKEIAVDVRVIAA
ncbi:MAG: sigma-54 factor interaction domain-containing protein, partial [Phycisphaerae bacterium]|nr:sigma-54 factor interaction domain-containing protein [Phycisphaerae bacterium]